jgi:predicted transposase YdaD
MGANRSYKDSVFSLLFNHPETLRDLYCALEGVTLPPDLPITINTLEGVLFLELHSSEVYNMLFTEWNWDDALAVRFEEGREEGREEIARNALAKGLPPDIIREITGLDIEAIRNIAQ